MSKLQIHKQVRIYLPKLPREILKDGSSFYLSQLQLDEEARSKPDKEPLLKASPIASKTTVPLKLFEIFIKNPKNVTDVNNLKSVPDKTNGVRNLCLRSKMPKPNEDPDYEINSDSESDSSTNDVTTLVRRRGGYKGPYKCNYCHEVFSESQKLRYHIIAKHIPSLKKQKDLQFQCITCKKIYTKLTTLNQHYMMHWNADKRPYPCTKCSKSFACAKSLRVHVITHSTERPFKCKICLQAFKRKAQYSLHNSNRKSHECNICHVKFCLDLKYKHHLNIHRTEAKDSEKFLCKVCGDSITGFREKAVHMKAHFKNSLPYKCNFCAKQFKCPSYLEVHMRFHTGEKPYKCEICNKHFSQPSNLMTHAKVHQERKPKKQGPCLRCESLKKSNDHAALARHKVMCGKEDDFLIKVPHSRLSRKKYKEMLYKCTECPKTFHLKECVVDHVMRTHLHLKPYQCLYCDMKFTHPTELSTHYRIHTNENPFKCDICGKEFKQSSHLKYHGVIHSDERPFKCPQCPKAFKTSQTLNTHLQLHTKELPYPCSMCSKEFPRSTVLKRHMKFHHLGIKEFKCLKKDCGKRFVTRTELKLHARSHSDERPFPCKLCSTSFKYKNHLTEHCRRQSHMKLLKIEERKKQKSSQ